MESEITHIFLATSVQKLRQMTGYLETCLAKLTDEQIWSRGAPHENSVGNLILHLCGNMRQWIGSGVGGEQDIRDRPTEFSTPGGLTAAAGPPARGPGGAALHQLSRAGVWLLCMLQVRRYRRAAEQKRAEYASDVCPLAVCRVPCHYIIQGIFAP